MPGPAPVCFEKGACLIDSSLLSTPRQVLISFSPSRSTDELATQASRSHLPANQSPPPARPPPTLRFGLIFVLLSFSCASPCAVIYNLPLLSGLTGSSGVTALAARTASTPQSQQHDGTPQSGNALGSPARPGGTGHQEDRASRGKTKITTCSCHCLRVLIDK